MTIYMAIRKGIEGSEFADTRTASLLSAEKAASLAAAYNETYPETAAEFPVLRIAKFECKEVPQ